MYYIDQYVRDIYALFKSRRLQEKCSMFFFYNYLCAKIALSKVFKIKFRTQKWKHYTFHFDNFSAFFAIFTELFIYNIYYFKTDKKTPRIVDCGGNIGMAVLYFKYLYPNAVVDCFEPDRGTFELLKKNIEANNLKDVKLINEAVSGEVWELEFYSLGDMEGGPGNSLEKSQAKFENLNTYKVPVTTLTAQGYEHLDFLKIDIEGSEGKVFVDIENNNLLSKIDRISLEYHYDPEISHNKLSNILRIFETANMETIINANTLVTTYVDEAEFARWNNRYVLMIDAYHR